MNDIRVCGEDADLVIEEREEKEVGQLGWGKEMLNSERRVCESVES